MSSTFFLALHQLIYRTGQILGGKRESGKSLPEVLDSLLQVSGQFMNLTYDFQIYPGAKARYEALQNSLRNTNLLQVTNFFKNNPQSPELEKYFTFWNDKNLRFLEILNHLAGVDLQENAARITTAIQGDDFELARVIADFKKRDQVGWYTDAEYAVIHILIQVMQDKDQVAFEKLLEDNDFKKIFTQDEILRLKNKIGFKKRYPDETFRKFVADKSKGAHYAPPLSWRFISYGWKGSSDPHVPNIDAIGLMSWPYQNKDQILLTVSRGLNKTEEGFIGAQREITDLGLLDSFFGYIKPSSDLTENGIKHSTIYENIKNPFDNFVNSQMRRQEKILPAKFAEQSHNYAATRLWVFMNGDYIVYMQIGKGDIHTVKNGNAVKIFAGYDGTTNGAADSLASTNFIDNLHVVVQPIHQAPDLIFVSPSPLSEAYGEKLRNDVILKWAEMIKQNGVDSAETSMKGWVKQIAEKVKEDITLVVLVNARYSREEQGIITSMSETIASSRGLLNRMKP